MFIVDFQPFPGNLAPSTADPTQQYDIKIDNHDILAATQDIRFRVTYGAPDVNDVQNVSLSEILTSNPAVSVPLAQGSTGQNLAIAAGGMFRSGIQDEPFFFDKGKSKGSGMYFGLCVCHEHAFAASKRTVCVSRTAPAAPPFLGKSASVKNQSAGPCLPHYATPPHALVSPFPEF